MKKLTIMLLAVAAIVVIACKGDATEGIKAAHETIDAAIESLNKATTLDEVTAIGDKFQEDLHALIEKYPALNELDENSPEAKEILEATNKFMDAATDKMTEVASKAIDDAVDDATKAIDDIAKEAKGEVE